jgi:hypothetical protein
VRQTRQSARPKAARVFPLDGIKKDELDTALGYFENNAPRMRYHWFRQCCLFVGSGVVEAACKAVIGQRLKQAGMHWTKDRADAIIALRCREASRSMFAGLLHRSMPPRHRVPAPWRMPGRWPSDPTRPCRGWPAVAGRQPHAGVTNGKCTMRARQRTGLGPPGGGCRQAVRAELRVRSG